MDHRTQGQISEDGQTNFFMSDIELAAQVATAYLKAVTLLEQAMLYSNKITPQLERKFSRFSQFEFEKLTQLAPEAGGDRASFNYVLHKAELTIIKIYCCVERILSERFKTVEPAYKNALETAKKYRGKTFDRDPEIAHTSCRIIRQAYVALTDQLKGRVRTNFDSGIISVPVDAFDLLHSRCMIVMEDMAYMGERIDNLRQIIYERKSRASAKNANLIMIVSAILTAVGICLSLAYSILKDVYPDRFNRCFGLNQHTITDSGHESPNYVSYQIRLGALSMKRDLIVLRTMAEQELLRAANPLEKSLASDRIRLMDDQLAVFQADIDKKPRVIP